MRELLDNVAVLCRNGHVRVAVSNLQGVLIKHRRSQQDLSWHHWPWGREAGKDQRRKASTYLMVAIASGQSTAPHGRAEMALLFRSRLRVQGSISESLRALTNLAAPTSPTWAPSHTLC